MKMIAHVALYGSLVFFDGERKAPFEKVRAQFYPNKTTYTIADGDGLQITVLPSAQGAGVCVKINGASGCLGIAWGGAWVYCYARLRVRRYRGREKGKGKDL